MYDYLADMLPFQVENKALALEFAHNVVHVCKAEDMSACAWTPKTLFFNQFQGHA